MPSKEDKILDAIAKVAESVAEVKQSQAALEERVENRLKELEQAPAPQSQAVDAAPKIVSTNEAERDIISLAHEILGNRFEVTTGPNQPGISYKLFVKAPDEIIDVPGGKSVAVISYLDGVEGARKFLLRTREFYVNHCQKIGKEFDKYANA